MNLIPLHGSHLGVPVAYKFDVLVHLIRLHFVEHNGMNVFATGQDSRKARLELRIQLTALLRAIDNSRQ